MHNSSLDFRIREISTCFVAQNLGLIVAGLNLGISWSCIFNDANPESSFLIITIETSMYR
jgi:hypothetical protein